MVPITSAPNCFIDGMGAILPVYRVDGDGNVFETGVSMSVSLETQTNGMTYRNENVDFPTASKALQKVRALLPGVKTKLTNSAPVMRQGMPAMGNARTNFYVVLGDAVAMAPAWLLLANSTLTPADPNGINARDIEFEISKLAPGIWGQILDAR